MTSPAEGGRPCYDVLEPRPFVRAASSAADEVGPLEPGSGKHDLRMIHNPMDNGGSSCHRDGDLFGAPHHPVCPAETLVGLLGRAARRHLPTATGKPTIAALRPAVRPASRRAGELALELSVPQYSRGILPSRPRIDAALSPRTLGIDAVLDGEIDLHFEGDSRHAARCAERARADRCGGLARHWLEQGPAEVESGVVQLSTPVRSTSGGGVTGPARGAKASGRAAEPSWLNGVRRVLLVNPPVADTLETEEQNMLTCTAPIGLLRVASWLRDRGRELRWLDCVRDGALRSRRRGRVRAEVACGNELEEGLRKPVYHFGLEGRALARRLASEPEPDLVAIGATFTWQLDAVGDLIGAARDAFPGATIAVGGNCARLVPTAVRELGADVVVRDELPGGDFMPAAIDLLAQSDGTDYPSLVRGCPHRCEYCVTPLLAGGRVAARDPARVVADMRARATISGVRRFVFYDDFIHYRQSRYLDRLLELVSAERAAWRLEFALGFSCGLVNERLVRRLRDAGLERAIVALESTSDERRRAMNRPDAMTEFARATAILRDYGFRRDRLRAFYLVGLPDQTTAEILRTVAWLYRQEVTPSLTTYALTPGTGDWDRYRPRVAHRSLGELAPTLWPFAHPGMRVRELDAMVRLFHERYRAAEEIDAVGEDDEPMMVALRQAARQARLEG